MSITQPCCWLLALLTATLAPLTRAASAANDVIVVADGREGNFRSSPLSIHLDSIRLPDDFLLAPHSRIHIRANGGQVSMPASDFVLHHGNTLHRQNGIEGAHVAGLALRPGEKNEARIVLPQLGVEVPFGLYVWNHTDRLIVSDIDGTITKEDLMGILFPTLDWTQEGVSELFAKIAAQGYRLVFLSARPLSWYNATHKYLAQTVRLPSGPVLLSPNSLGDNLDVIAEPTEYKKRSLDGVKRLFPAHQSPFQAGMGNAETDRVAYAGAGMPYIFMVNPEGQLQILTGEEVNGRPPKMARSAREGDTAAAAVPIDYTSLAAQIDVYFPRVK